MKDIHKMKGYNMWILSAVSSWQFFVYAKPRFMLTRTHWKIEKWDRMAQGFSIGLKMQCRIISTTVDWYFKWILIFLLCKEFFHSTHITGDSVAAYLQFLDVAVPKCSRSFPETFSEFFEILLSFSQNFYYPESHNTSQRRFLKTYDRRNRLFYFF